MSLYYVFICVHSRLWFVGWHRSCVPSWCMYALRWLPSLAAILCGLLTIEGAWSRDHATSSVTAVLPPPGQRCGTVCLNSFGNRTSPSDNSNDRWKCLCLVSWAAAPCVWTLRALTRNLTYLLTYLLTYIMSLSLSVVIIPLPHHPPTKNLQWRWYVFRSAIHTSVFCLLTRMS